MTRTAARIARSPGSGARSVSQNFRATDSNGSPTFHTRGRPSGLTLVNTRRMRFPLLGWLGKLSTCNRVSSFRHVCLRPATSTGRRLVLAWCNPPAYDGRSVASRARVDAANRSMSARRS